MDEHSLEGKTAVVSGVAAEDGLAMARRFGRAGARVVIAHENADAAASMASTLSGEGLDVTHKTVNMRDADQIRGLVDEVARQHGSIEIWVNESFAECLGAAETLSARAWNDCIEANLSSAFWCAQAVGRHMLGNGGGVIISIATNDGYMATEGRSALCVANAGLIMLTQALGVEWAKRGVRVVGISRTAPGMVEASDPSEDSSSGPTPADQLYRRIPLRRRCTPEDLAEAAFFLASEQASYITAETIRVDGGWTAYQFF